MNEKIQVLIADDHEIVRDGLRMILETAEDINVIGMAADGDEVVSQSIKLKPDVVLLDLRMPRVDGISALKTLMQTEPHPQVVVLTTYNEPDLMIKALESGALGYLLKDTDRETLFNTIRAAASGKSLLEPGVINHVMSRLGETSPSERSTDPLTERELEVLRGVALGERNKEIGFRLGISERTVKAHLTNIYNKLGVDSRASAVASAIQGGLLNLDEDPLS